MTKLSEIEITIAPDTSHLNLRVDIIKMGLIIIIVLVMNLGETIIITINLCKTLSKRIIILDKGILKMLVTIIAQENINQTQRVFTHPTKKTNSKTYK